MKAIVNFLKALDDVNDVLLIQDAHVLESTLDDNRQVQIQSVLPKIECLFSELQQTGSTYEEVCFTIGDQQLVIFPANTHLKIILLVDRKARLSLIRLSVLVATEKLESQAA